MATIYNVTYSLVNGSITAFDPVPTDNQTANIIQAPLQLGFGANYLYQQAALSYISTTSLPTIFLAQAFSEAGIAGSSGALNTVPNIAQRFRYDWTMTRVSKGPLILLVTTCLLYAVLGLVAMALDCM